MNEEKYRITVCGAPVVYTSVPPPPYNPLRRPKICYWKMVLALALFLLTTAGVSYLANRYAPDYRISISCAWALLYLCCIAKRAVIWLVHFYQNKAPDWVRLRCVFEPSCSEYMLLAIEKYGFLRGVWKGFWRLMRCHPPNGGKDYP